jgi:hypothetical protein
VIDGLQAFPRVAAMTGFEHTGFEHLAGMKSAKKSENSHSNAQAPGMTASMMRSTPPPQ